MFEEVKCAIKIAAAGTNPVSTGIKCNDGRYHDIECPGFYKFAVFRLLKAIPIQFELGFGRYLAKAHREIFSDDGRKNALFHPPCAIDERPGVDLVMHRQVAADECTAAKPGRTNDGIRNFF